MPSSVSLQVTLTMPIRRPNMITLMGLMFIVANVVLLLYMDTDLLLKSSAKLPSVPNWVYFMFAFGLFMYQSLDAIDGKQARRTGTSSPLGELFDHGCDALNASVCRLNICESGC